MNKKEYKLQGKKGLFDREDAINKLSEIGNPLERISKVIDFEVFRPILEDKLLNKNKKSNAGAKPFDLILMFKIVILQRYYGLGDKQVEYQIIDRISFKQFLGLETGDNVPDEKTVWAFKEELTKNEVNEFIFAQFSDFLEKEGLIFNEGKLVDASFTLVPRQRNTPIENEIIKNNEGNELWNDKPNKKCHKDIDARWTKKNNENFYGFKNHIVVDSKSKFIDNYVVTSASVHDSQTLESLLKPEYNGQPLYGDSAYTGPKQEETIKANSMINEVNEKGARNKPLTKEQKEANKIKSSVRSRVEHIFGFMEQSMNGLAIKTIGLVRAKSNIGLINLVYNMFRFEQVKRLELF